MSSIVYASHKDNRITRKLKETISTRRAAQAVKQPNLGVSCIWLLYYDPRQNDRNSISILRS
jgi:hypothetical protein